MMRLVVPLELTYDQTQRLINVAYSAGWMRENPRKAWGDNETKEACRVATRYLVDKATIMKNDEET